MARFKTRDSVTGEIDVLKSLSEGTDRVTDLARQQGLSKSTTHRLLKLLEPNQEEGVKIETPWVADPWHVSYLNCLPEVTGSLNFSGSVGGKRQAEKTKKPISEEDFKQIVNRVLKERG
jgi:hypothetical protein